MKTFVASFLALFVLILSSCNNSCIEDAKPIKAYDIDFNWGEGGPNGFAAPGL
jgi:hypothetical protein